MKRNCSRCPVGGSYDDNTQTCSVSDPEDGLPVTCVGEWSADKHERLRRYVEISRAVRRKFEDRAGATYIDLYCGPGRARVKETGTIIDGSAIVASKSAVEAGSPFTNIHVADVDESFLSSIKTRLLALGVNAETYPGPASHTVEEIVQKINPHGLNFAFLDPYNLDSLPFTVIETLAYFKRMDLLIHVSIQDLQRNLRRYLKSDRCPIDVFCPGWRNAVNSGMPDETIRQSILNYWLNLIRGLDMEPSQGIEIVTGGKNQPLYWLVFAARHDRAGEFWDKIRNLGSQMSIDLGEC